MNVLEALDDLAASFELKKAIKMVIKYAVLQKAMEPLSFLLNQMFNKAKGCEIVQKDGKFSGSSDFKKFKQIVAKLEEMSPTKDSVEDDDDDFQEAGIAAYSESEDFNEPEPLILAKKEPKARLDK